MFLQLIISKRLMRGLTIYKNLTASNIIKGWSPVDLETVKMLLLWDYKTRGQDISLIRLKVNNIIHPSTKSLKQAQIRIKLIKINKNHYKELLSQEIQICQEMIKQYQLQLDKRFKILILHSIIYNQLKRTLFIHQRVRINI